MKISFESYLINGSQALHMALMALLVPLLIGLEQFGLFAAVFSFPGVISSFIELYFMASITNPRLRAGALLQFLTLSAVGVMVIFSVAGLLFDFWLVLASVALFALLVLRAFVFSLAIASGGHTRQIVRSELVVLASYSGALFACFHFGQSGAFVPLAMASSGLLLGSLSLGFETFTSIQALSRESRFRVKGLFAGMSMKTTLGKTFEDGFLTLPPFLLATAFSNEIAGLFRVMVTVLKGGFKFFPLRHDIVLREFSGGTVRNVEIGAKIRRASDLFSVCGVLLGLPITAFVFVRNDSSLAFCLLGSGFVISALALYPAASLASTTVRWTGVIAVVLLAITAMYLPLWAFSLAFILFSAGISRLCLGALAET